ncbi:MAG: hypothetical protein TR69_WS6001001065 [candidate division WS6 bacterium OLB20]|uniref:Uncharacterized protein n=1 Tax=candidate division WS6 bacterium OLB20 TaxID=1617426 RepID=A0A136LZF7_9BACT|nr:MAG: hypothetical protein TR69_WS6001001065 [candidate division WS6 bacterium OLB20]
MMITAHNIEADLIMELFAGGVSLLLESGCDVGTIMFGIGAEDDDLWRTKEIQLVNLYSLVKRKVDEATFKPGYCDLFIRWRDCEFTICNDTGVHFVTDRNEQLYEKFADFLTEEGLKVSFSNEVRFMLEN